MGYYQEYLSNLCHRRQWPEPYYTLYRHRTGFSCVARVNNREYLSDSGLESTGLAKEDAAMQAYWRCQNFSRNDGMHPKDHGRGQNVQGKPIAIGTERASTYSEDSRSSGSRSGGSSPTSSGVFAPYGPGQHRPSTSSSHGSKRSNGSSRGSKHRSNRY